MPATMEQARVYAYAEFGHKLNIWKSPAR